ncbi:hypothetical protein NQ315_015588 [Exocentrus adspersus]|uniref:E3 ubiquitin-protein ligase E3D n=1 Tax=Exocentrus adspersus TaxID=1586481 RepID=A0AAV8VA45_9CUCU|nr:hypothetical protein NQ315_015588 [Exocentrus adspersus]
MSSSSTTEIYKSVVLEVRPRLQSVNVFITLLSNNTSVNIVLENDEIHIIENDTISIITCKDINVVPNSLSAFRKTDNFVTFRFATNNAFENLGGFKTELLQNTVASIESLSNKPLLIKGTSYIIHCINCNKQLSATIKFERILPLPSDHSDPSDWFCHAHGSKDNISLDPKNVDVFYTYCYVHINRTNLLHIKTSDKVIVCKYCLSWLGITFNKNTFRLWLNTVKFIDNNSAISTDSLSDVFHSFKDIFRHSLYNSLKLMATCYTLSNQTDSLLIWVLEKKLQIFIDASGEGLKKYDVAKVLFRYAKNSDDAYIQWQNDPMVNAINVSKPMMLDVLKHLHKSNKILPPEFSKSSDFNVSYVFIFIITPSLEMGCESLQVSCAVWLSGSFKRQKFIKDDLAVSPSSRCALRG